MLFRSVKLEGEDYLIRVNDKNLFNAMTMIDQKNDRGPAMLLAMKGLTDEQIARIIGWSAKRVSEIRARYVDEARVVISLVERLTASA